MDNIELGKIGEDAAVKFLTAKGYRIFCRNYRCKWGEVDIVAQKNSAISFIEVKTRQNRNYGRPCESVTATKQQHIRKTACRYLKELKQHGYVVDSISFDIIEINIEHMKKAF